LYSLEAFLPRILVRRGIPRLTKIKELADPLLSKMLENNTLYTVKKVSDFPVPSRDVTITNLSLAGNYLIISGQGEFGG
jgi:hypothetical protein